MASVRIRDETSAGTVSHEFSLDILTAEITVRELIRSRVYQEVKEYNATQPDHFRGLIQPTDTEQTPSGYRMRSGRMIDWEKQHRKAIEAFGANGFIVLVDRRQVESLDETITIATDTAVTFLRLVPLVGG